jgi:pimeloyl-ACP methyl ester carboxylesterase
VAEVEPLELPAGACRFSGRVAGPPDGRLVILLHGFPQTSRSWLEQLSALAERGYRAVAPDQRGYSPGARPDGVEHYRIDHLVSDVIAIADEMGGHRFDLVGHDWGAGVAWHTAARYPSRLRTLTVVSMPHPRALGDALRHAEQAARSAYVAFFRTPKAPELALLAGGGVGLRRLLAGTGVPPEAADEYVAALSQPGALTAALNWYRANDVHALAEIGPVTTPTLYVWSTGDVAVGRRAAEGTAAFVEGPYRFEVLDGVSHWVPEEAGAELGRVLLEHLAAHE